MLSFDIHHRQGDFTLAVAAEIGPGLTALSGPSGSGKTTILKIIAGLIRPQAGHVRFADTVFVDPAQRLWLPPHQRRCGMVFQEARLFPHLTVRQNLLYGAWFRRARGDAADLAGIVGLLGLDALLNRRPANLSGGEAQRVALGRALLAKPRLLLMDEPLAALDAARKADILPYLEKIRDTAQVPILYVSHAQAEIERLASRVLHLADGRFISEQN
ncbi:MAG: molybdenum ABC transporter ATP-binding protein [Elstera sp.]